MNSRRLLRENAAPADSPVLPDPGARVRVAGARRRYAEENARGHGDDGFPPQLDFGRGSNPRATRAGERAVHRRVRTAAGRRARAPTPPRVGENGEEDPAYQAALRKFVADDRAYQVAVAAWTAEVVDVLKK